MDIKVIGVGGGGCKAVSRMYSLPIPGVRYACVDTDVPSLTQCELPNNNKMRIGEKLTRGLGNRGDPERGRMAAEESGKSLEDLVQGADMVFIVAGMGGGTGTGAAPVLAELAKEAGALTIGIVTQPSRFEGVLRRDVADEGVLRLREKVDCLIVVPNDRLLELADKALSMDGFFKIVDDILRQGVQAIAELALNPGEINLDFSDIRTVMTNAGVAWMAIGSGKEGQGRAMEAARAAINSPLSDHHINIKEARGVLLNITGGPNLSVHEMYEAAEMIQSSMGPNAYIFFGRVIDPKMEDEVRITLIATGIPVPVSTR